MTEKRENHYLKLPDSGLGSGILVLHAWWGLNNFVKSFCDRLANEGFVVLAPDLYYGKIANTIPEAENLRKKTNQKQICEDVLTAMEALKASPNVNNQRMNVIGFSMGAYWALWLALEKPKEIGSVTVFYGSRSGDYSQSQAAFLGHFAETDRWVTASGLKTMEKNLHSAKRPLSFYTYPGTGHWFFESDRPESYHPDAAQLAWERTIDFLKQRVVI